MNLVLLIHINREAEVAHPLKFLYEDLFHNTGTLGPNIWTWEDDAELA